VTVDPRLLRLFEAEFDNMVGLARVISDSRDDVEDIVMDAFVETARRLDTVDCPGGYLRTAVVHGARRRYRNRVTRQRIRYAHSQELASQPSPEVGEHYVADLLDNLGEREHTALGLIYFADLTYDQAAELMDCPTGTVKSLVSRALQKLREEVRA
jgi:RNA polymerase sigma factor (sigma-70 family)